MSELFFHIIDKLKRINGLQYDDEVAQLLGLKKSNFSDYKTRGVIPVKQIVAYCIKNDISIDSILIERPSTTPSLLPIVGEQNVEYENDEIKLMHIFRSLNAEHQGELLDLAEFLAEQEQKKRDGDTYSKRKAKGVGK